MYYTSHNHTLHLRIIFNHHIVMKYRSLGKTGFNISEVSLGTWQLGSKWGEPFDEARAMETLETAVNHGINFFDTADIYQNGMSEKVIGKFLKNHRDIYVSTKCGRRLNPHTTSGYTAANIRQFVVDSIHNMQTDHLDMVLLHCPPTEVYSKDEVFEELDRLKKEGSILHYGVSVEKIDEAVKAMSYDISAIEIIFNMFRLRPADELFAKATRNNIGIIARVPLASGLLSGKFTLDTKFGKDDHRSYNRNGDFFDKGETFSGVDYQTGIAAANRLKEQLHTDNLANAALRYILMYDAVSTVIPGASSPEQIAANASASDCQAFTDEQMAIVRQIYDTYIKPDVHHLW